MMYQVYREQKLKCTKEELWDFISSPENLQRITPKEMGFQIVSAHLPEKMYPGMMISYKVSPIGGFRMNWVTEITQVESMEFFIDEQRVGPYRLWHHEHRLIQEDDGVLMTDLVSYLPPFGFLGRIANGLFIKKRLEAIFDYRERIMTEIFPEPGR